MIPSVLDITVITPYETQVVLKVFEEFNSIENEKLQKKNTGICHLYAAIDN